MISDAQLSVLKIRYLANSKPRREELLKIAAQIGHPFKVVKVRRRTKTKTISRIKFLFFPPASKASREVAN